MTFSLPSKLNQFSAHFLVQSLEFSNLTHHFINTTSFLGNTMQSNDHSEKPSYIVDLTEQNFQHVLEGSFEKPILIHFWSPGIPESAQMIPLLEKITHEYEGALVLALINCEQQQKIAVQFGIRTLPTLALFDKGQPTDSVEGVQTEKAIRDMLAPYLPNQDEMAFEKILVLISEGEYEKALVLLKPLESTLSETGIYKLTLAQCNVETQQFETAETILTTVLMQDQDALYTSLMAKIQLHKQAADTPEIRELQIAYDADPSNGALAYSLALQFSQVARQEEALELLISLLRKDLHFSDGAAKKTMMDILIAMGQGNETASRYRRQLYSLLY